MFLDIYGVGHVYQSLLKKHHRIGHGQSVTVRLDVCLAIVEKFSTLAGLMDVERNVQEIVAAGN